MKGMSIHVDLLGTEEARESDSRLAIRARGIVVRVEEIVGLERHAHVVVCTRAGRVLADFQGLELWRINLACRPSRVGHDRRREGICAGRRDFDGTRGVFVLDELPGVGEDVLHVCGEPGAPDGDLELLGGLVPLANGVESGSRSRTNDADSHILVGDGAANALDGDGGRSGSQCLVGLERHGDDRFLLGVGGGLRDNRGLERGSLDLEHLARRVERGRGDRDGLGVRAEAEVGLAVVAVSRQGDRAGILEIRTVDQREGEDHNLAGGDGAALPDLEHDRAVVLLPYGLPRFLDRRWRH
mmetsp:Transcript_4159/g.9898  ORF Transcript_4159/g.9898 Transcript_4159/m.9898 type:complete len:299 (+) Transcript_4159:4840-5736(+)